MSSGTLCYLVITLNILSCLYGTISSINIEHLLMNEVLNTLELKWPLQYDVMMYLNKCNYKAYLPNPRVIQIAAASTVGKVSNIDNAIMEMPNRAVDMM